MSDYLPIEVWNDILTRLPIKTLLKIRSVCKLFHSFISNPSFISTHLTKINQNQTHNNNTLVLRQFNTPVVRHFTENQRHKKERYLLFNDSIPTPFNENNIVELEFPFKTKSTCHFRIVGSCNGVLCLSDDHGSYAYGIILWNPSIKRFLRLPKPRVCQRTYGSYMSVLGFGFDWKRNDYKVVRVAYIRGRNGKDLIPPEVEVYSVSSGAWRSFNAGAPPYGIYGYTWTQAFLNGVVHWNGYDPCMVKGNDKRGLIVSFDVCDEVFLEVRLPECLEQCGWDLSVITHRGRLGVLQNECCARRKSSSIWVMEEYGVVESWTKLYSVDFKGGLQKLIGFMENGEVLGVTVRGKLVSYDPITLRMNSLGIRGAIEAFHVDTYMESLVLLEAERADVGSEAIICEGGEEEEEAPNWPRVKNRYDEFEREEKLENFPFGWTSEQ